jgi:hypothetical protein
LVKSIVNGPVYHTRTQEGLVKGKKGRVFRE